MSYSIDVNVLLYASNTGAAEHEKARAFLDARPGDPDLCCLTWPTLMAYQRIATHPSIFDRPLSPEAAWGNIVQLLRLPRVMVLTENDAFASIYTSVTRGKAIRGNLVPDAHLAALLQLHGVRRLYSKDSDFRKFEFLEVVDPFT